LNNPDYLLDEDNVENAVVDLDNNSVFAQHVLCAAQELPLTHEDSNWFDHSRLTRAVSMWKRAGKLVGTLDGGVQYNNHDRPQDTVSLYATTDEQFEVQCAENDLEMEPIGKQRAFRDFHDGAIVLHQGQQYEVIEFNNTPPNRCVTLSPVNVNYYTQSIRETRVSDVTVTEKKRVTTGVTVCRGTGTVNIDYTGYKQKDITSNEARPVVHDIDLPPVEMDTQLMWLELSQSVVDDLVETVAADDTIFMDDRTAVLGGLHALEHGMIALSPLELRMDKNDLGGLSQLRHPERNDNATLFVYDGVSGGVGFATAIYNHFETIFEQTCKMIRDCECGRVDGCPACVVEDSCGSGNEPLHTKSALTIARHCST